MGRSCKWCAEGQCWTHGGGKGRARVTKTIVKPTVTRGFATKTIVRPSVTRGFGKTIVKPTMTKGVGKKRDGCKWCAQGQCWSQKCAKGGAKGGARSAIVPRKGAGKGGNLSCKWCAQGQCWSHGCGGKSSSKGQGGQWLFVPESMTMDPKTAQWNKTMDKLNKFTAEQKVWVGGLPKKATWKELEKHAEENTGTKPKVTEILGKGRGCCAFKSVEDAQAAIACLNGSELDGNAIEADVWTEKEKKEGDAKPKRKFGAAFVKRGNTDGAVKLTAVDGALKVWVGGLSAKTTVAQLKQHFVDNGHDADNGKLMKSGTACMTFKTEEEAAGAIGGLSGSELDGKTIEVDVWTKGEKNGK